MTHANEIAQTYADQAARRKEIAESYPKLRDLDITTKAAYLAWVDHWKETYKSLARMIKDAKKDKRYHRDQARLQPCPNESREWHRAKMWDAHSLAYGGRWRAADMMYWRAEGKNQSWVARCKALGEVNMHASATPDASQEDNAA